MVKKWLGWAIFITAILVVVVVALNDSPDAPAPETPTKPPTSVIPTEEPTEEPTTPEPEPTETPSAGLDDALTRYSIDSVWEDYTPAKKQSTCESLDLLGPEATAEIFKGQDDADLLDPDVAVDELTSLCNDYA
ncbi:hypothetical protein [Streptomyces chartreusis]